MYQKAKLRNVHSVFDMTKLICCSDFWFRGIIDFDLELGLKKCIHYQNKITLPDDIIELNSLMESREFDMQLLDRFSLRYTYNSQFGIYNYLYASVNLLAL